MNDINHVELRGRIGREPVLRTTPSGRAVLDLLVATTGTVLDPEATQEQSVTQWHRVKVIGRQAQTLGDGLQKGDLINVTGRLQTIEKFLYGRKAYQTEVIANTINGNSTADR